MVRYEMQRVASISVLIHNRAGGTGVDALGAGTALIDASGVGWKVEADRHPGQEEPRAQVWIDETRVLADPSQPRVFGEHSFLNVMLVDENERLEGAVARLPHPGDEGLESLGEDEVIVLAPGVARDPG